MPKRRQTSTTPLRLPPDLKDWAKAQAKDADISLNAWIVSILERMRAKDNNAAQ